MFSNRQLARKLKTEVNAAALEHTFGREVRSCDVDLQESQQETEPAKETRIKLLSSFQESYMSDHSVTRQEDKGVSKSELLALQNRIDFLKAEVAKERMAAEMSHSLVEVQRSVNEYLQERLALHGSKPKPASGSIHRNRKLTSDHLNRLVESFTESGQNYCRAMELLAESHGDHPA